MYAIIATGGKQYRVEEGLALRVEKIEGEEGSIVTFDNVLAVSDGALKLGDDIKGAKVEAQVLAQGKGKKIVVYKYKRKSGYHKKQGHRQYYTAVRITKISV